MPPGIGQGWPERPEGAEWVERGGRSGPLWGYWHVWGLPPSPWPTKPSEGWDRATFGPPGTTWGPFSADQVEGRELGRDQPDIPRKIVYLLRKLGVRFVDGVGNWSVPFEWADPALPVEVTQVRWLQTVIHAKLGTTEEIAHVLNWRTAPQADVDLTIAQVKAFGDAVRDQWKTFWNFATPSGNHVSAFFDPAVVYNEVRTAYLEQNQPATPPLWKPPKPVYLVDTQYSPFAPADAVGTATAGQAMPWEVAMVLSLNTNLRGPRNRGRLYLGGLSRVAFSAELFSQAAADGIGAAFGSQFVSPLNLGPTADLHIVSKRYATSAPVQGVRVGYVPDSQRRRRRKQLEAYKQDWGTAVGMATP